MITPENPFESKVWEVDPTGLFYQYLLHYCDHAHQQGYPTS